MGASEGGRPANQRGKGYDRRPGVQITEGDQRTGRSHDEPRPFQPNCGDQEADARRNRVFERRGDGGDQPLAKADAGRHNEDGARNRHGAERDPPRHPHADDHGVDEEEIVAHRGRDGDRIVREQRHQRRRKRGREARGRQHGAEVHACGAQDGRLDEDDIRHGQKSREASEDLGSDGRAVGGERELAFEELHAPGILNHEAHEDTKSHIGLRAFVAFVVAIPPGVSRGACS